MNMYSSAAVYQGCCTKSTLSTKQLAMFPDPEAHARATHYNVTTKLSGAYSAASVQWFYCMVECLHNTLSKENYLLEK